jgi:hypothetical protein
MKHVIMTAKDDDDLARAMLAMMQTPIAPGQPSPSELHLGRRVRDEMHPDVRKFEGSWLEFQQWKQLTAEQQAKYFNRGTRKLEPLKVGDEVMVWHREEWHRGRVEALLTRPRSYQVRLHETGQKLERNRVLIRKIPADTMDETAKRTNPSALFRQALQVPTHPLRMGPWQEDGDRTGPREDEDPDLDSDPDHEYYEAEEEASESESENENELGETEGDDTNTDQEEEEPDSPSPVPPPPAATTRAGRQVRPPNRYTPPPR